MKGTARAGRFETKVREILADRVGPIHANVVFESAIRQLGLLPGSLEESHREKLAASLARPLRAYLDETRVRMLQREITRMQAGSEHPPVDVEIAIRAEGDVIRARADSRDLAAKIGFDAVDAIKIATVVSELARNMHSYAGGGRLFLRPQAQPRGIEIEAVDNGPGIADVDAILSGRYRSKSGLGLGIAGSKRLLDAMDVRTGPTGTRIVGQKRVS